MHKSFYTENRRKLSQYMEDGSVVFIFSGFAPRKRADEDYAFCADRNFVYLTGISRDAGLIYAMKKVGGTVSEKLFLLPADLLKERWTGRRTKADEAAEISGITDIAYTADFDEYRKTALSECKKVYVDIDTTREERDYTEAHRFGRAIKDQYSGIEIENIRPALAEIRTIKADCEIEAMREAVRITGEGIKAMMHGVRDGMK